MTDNKSAGKIASGRRIVRNLDILIQLCDTDEVFGSHERQDTQALIDALIRARKCAANVLLRLGDQTAYETTPIVKMTVAYPGEIDRETLPICPGCGHKMDFIRPTADGKRLFRCPQDETEHIL